MTRDRWWCMLVMYTLKKVVQGGSDWLQRNMDVITCRCHDVGWI